MKKFILVFAALFLALTAPYAQTGNPDTKSSSVVKFKEVTWDFGKVPVNSDVSHKFTFKNISKERINIREVRPSCGCTTPKFSSEPIKPHRKGEIMVKYDSKRVGEFHKTLDVLLSNQETIVLTIQGEILDTPKADNK